MHKKHTHTHTKKTTKTDMHTNTRINMNTLSMTKLTNTQKKLANAHTHKQTHTHAHSPSHVQLLETSILSKGGAHHGVNGNMLMPWSEGGITSRCIRKTRNCPDVKYVLGSQSPSVSYKNI